MRNMLLVLVIVVAFVLFQGSVAFCAEQEETKCGVFAVQLAKLIGLGDLSEHDAVTKLQANGVEIGDPEKVLSKEEIANTLAKVLDFDVKTTKNMDIANQNRAIITALEGNVDVKLTKQAQWSKASVGMQLSEESAIRTGQGSSVNIKVGMIGAINVKENTELALESLRARQNGSENIILYITIGEMLVNVQWIPPRTNWTTATPTTLAAVRGTIYTIRVRPAKTELTEVIENEK